MNICQYIRGLEILQLHMGGGRMNSGLPRTWQQWVSHPIHVNECRMVYEVRNNVLKSPEIIRTPTKHLSPSSQQHRYVLHLKCDGEKICFLSVYEIDSNKASSVHKR